MLKANKTMTKTIEEAMKSIAKNFIIENKSRINNDAPLTHECVQYTIERIFAMPLSSRITPEEKERVRVLYNEEFGMAQHFHAKAKASNDISCRQHYYGLREPYISRMKLLERIFGKDFFKEEE